MNTKFVEISRERLSAPVFFFPGGLPWGCCMPPKASSAAAAKPPKQPMSPSPRSKSARSAPSKGRAPEPLAEGPGKAHTSPRDKNKPSAPGARKATLAPPGADSLEGNRVRVVVRLRPMFTAAGSAPDEAAVSAKGNVITVAPSDANDRRNRRQFEVDSVVGPKGGQADVYDCVKEAVANTVAGTSACIMCYGQTGAGKTYTLANFGADAAMNGIMPRAFETLFKALASMPENSWKVTVTYVQIYMEVLSDLLDPEATITLREDSNGQVLLNGAAQREVRSPEECLDLMRIGSKHRMVSFTKMNATSSRSHAIFITTVRTISDTLATTSSLYLVDLAGSERIERSGVMGITKDEAISINVSLTALGRCIQALADSRKKAVPPFRESKLTRILSNVFHGGARVALLVCCAVGQRDVTETNSSLEFARQAMRITVKNHKQQAIDYQVLADKLQAEIDAFQVKQLAQETLSQAEIVAERKKYLESLNAQAELEEKVTALRAENTAIQHELISYRSSEVSQRDLEERIGYLEEVNAKYRKEMEELKQKLAVAQADVPANGATATAAPPLANGPPPEAPKTPVPAQAAGGKPPKPAQKPVAKALDDTAPGKSLARPMAAPIKVDRATDASEVDVSSAGGGDYFDVDSDAGVGPAPGNGNGARVDPTAGAPAEDQSASRLKTHVTKVLSMIRVVNGISVPTLDLTKTQRVVDDDDDAVSDDAAYGYFETDDTATEERTPKA